MNCEDFKVGQFNHVGHKNSVFLNTNFLMVYDIVSGLAAVVSGVPPSDSVVVRTGSPD